MARGVPGVALVASFPASLVHEIFDGSKTRPGSRAFREGGTVHLFPMTTTRQRMSPVVLVRSTRQSDALPPILKQELPLILKAQILCNVGKLSESGEEFIGSQCPQQLHLAIGKLTGDVS